MSILASNDDPYKFDVVAAVADMTLRLPVAVVMVRDCAVAASWE